MRVIDVNFPKWVTIINGRIVHTLSHLQFAWKVWDLRGFTLISLALQTILIFCAPFRKRTANIPVIVSIWLAYLLADFVATQAVGLIPNYSRNHFSSSSNSTDVSGHLLPHADLLSFWSPFLLVHLGGPDTITALALEDNELWTRTALHLCTQVGATGRVFFQSLPASGLWVPTVLMFIAGILKYLERTSSLYYARLTKFKTSMLSEPDPGPNYSKLMESYDSYRTSNLPAKFHTNPEPDQYKFDPYSATSLETLDEDDETPDLFIDTDRCKSWKRLIGCLAGIKKKQDKTSLKNLQLVRDAFEFFEKYKGLYVDLIFSFRDRNESRENFLKRSSSDAFRVVEIELNFTYEVFFTKMVVIHHAFGTAIRCVSFACEVLALLIWILFIKKHKFLPQDIWITYILLVGAIVLDIIAFVRVLCSDWKIAVLDKESEVRAFLYDKMLSIRNRTWGEYSGKDKCPRFDRLRRILFRRWSESVLQFNLINYCVDPWSRRSEFFFAIVPFKDKFDEIYVSKKWFANDLRDFIFNEIRHKAEIADDPRDADEICESKGDWVLRSFAGLDFDPFVFYKWTHDIEYDESLLLWHVATELLYQETISDEHIEQKKTISKDDEYRTHCKTLSDYMMYLLNRKPKMMFAVAGISEVRFRDTCAETIKFFERVLPKRSKKETKQQRHKNACERITKVNTETNPKDIKGDRSKSVLFDACCLATKLKNLKSKKVGMWELMAKVWVDLVCYSATHCRADAHAAQLKQGGELLSLIWLLMFHMGLGRQFRITQGNARSKLIISK